MSRIHSIPGTIVSSALFCGKSSAFIIEPQSAWNVRMDRRNGDLDLQTYYSAEASTQKGRRMHQNTHMGLPKIKKNLARGTAPPQTLPNGKLTSLSTLHPIFSVSARLRRSILASSALHLGGPKRHILDPSIVGYLYVVAAAASLESTADRTQFIRSFSTKRTPAKMQ